MSNIVKNTPFDARNRAPRVAGRVITPADIQKETELTQISAGIYGRLSIFDPCSAGDVFGLQVLTTGLMNWLGWRPNPVYSRNVDFIAWWGPQGTAAGSPTSGAGDPAAAPNSWEYGMAGYSLTHTSWYHRQGEGVGPHATLNRCETSPRYRLNGQIITDDLEWQLNGIMGVLQNDVANAVINGSHLNAFQTEGLLRLIKTGYVDRNNDPTPMIDSYVVDWAEDDLDGGVNTFGNYFEYLDQVVTDIEYRSSGIGKIAEQDMVLLTSRFMATELLDAYACYTTCGVTTTADITDQALRAQQRAERRALNGGPLYDGTSAVGYIQLKSGRKLPIIVDDNITIGIAADDNYMSDILLLTRRIGTMDVLYGEYLDLREWVNMNTKNRGAGFTGFADAAGRFAFKSKEDNWTSTVLAGTSPELYLSAPWAQARFQDVKSTRRKISPSNYSLFQDFYPGPTTTFIEATSFS